MAIEYGGRWDIRDFEIRELQSGRIPYIHADERREFIKSVKDSGVTIAALSPGIFKACLTDKETIDFQRKQCIFDTFKLADEVKTSKILIFGIERYENEPEENYQTVLELMGEMSLLGEKNGFLICVENEAGHWFDSGENSVKILRELNSEFLQANWDPGNSLLSGEVPFPDGYNYIKEYMANLHIKDYIKNEEGEYEAVPAGEGLIDWNGQLKEIIRESVLNAITIETHCTPLLEKSEKSITNVRAILNNFM